MRVYVPAGVPTTGGGGGPLLLPPLHAPSIATNCKRMSRKNTAANRLRLSRREGQEESCEGEYHKCKGRNVLRKEWE